MTINKLLTSLKVGSARTGGFHRTYASIPTVADTSGGFFDRAHGQLYHSIPVIQRKVLLLTYLLGLVGIGGCERASPVEASGEMRIISLSPAATDLLLAMGAERQIVGVSTYDNDPRVAALPRVGDYESVDWERIQALAPSVMIVQGRNRLSTGFTDRAKSLNVKLHAAQIDRFTDIIVEADQIGAAVGRADEARSMWKGLREKIDDVKTRVEAAPKVKTLLVTSADGLGVAGPETYLDDILGFAGGVNALGPDRKGYATIDREIVLALAPDAIIQLLPGATPSQIEAAERLWKSMPDCPAVKAGRVYTFTQDWVLAPNAHVGELAEMMVGKLHPEAH